MLSGKSTQEQNFNSFTTESVNWLTHGRIIWAPVKIEVTVIMKWSLRCTHIIFFSFDWISHNQFEFFYFPSFFSFLLVSSHFNIIFLFLLFAFLLPFTLISSPVRYLGQQNTPTASLQRGNTPPPYTPTSVLDLTLNTLMVRFQLRGMRSAPSLSSLPCPLWPGVVAPDKSLIWWVK